MDMTKRVSDSDAFNTPQFFYDQLNRIFSFEIDAACDSSNIKAPVGFCYDLGINGLSKPWIGRVFVNPPFSKKQEWIEKAIQEVESGNCPICVMILPLNCISADAFFNKVIMGGYMYEILNRRIQFLDNVTKKPVPGNDTGTVVVYFKKRLCNGT
jgi:hypothetical protein